MSDSALGKVHMKRKDLRCPRDAAAMQEKTVGEAEGDRRALERRREGSLAGPHRPLPADVPRMNDQRRFAL